MGGVGKNKVANALSNFSVQYNYMAISVAIVLLSQQDGTVPDWAESVLTSTVFGGSIIGMLVMGYLGDAMGRRQAMELTLFLTFLGAFGSALLSWGSDDARYLLMAAWRMLMGVGIGGIYPLSSALSFEEPPASVPPLKEQQQELAEGGRSESIDTAGAGGGGSSSAARAPEKPEKGSGDSTSWVVAYEDERERRRATAWAVFWQQPGQLMPYVVALLMLAAFDLRQLELQYRTVLFVGALPPLGILVNWASDAAANGSSSIFSPKRWLDLLSKGPATQPIPDGEASGAVTNGTATATAEQLLDAEEREKSRHESMIATYCRLLRDPRYGRRLAGTCLSWMLFDIYAYGVTLYTPEIMEEVFGSSDTIAEDYWQNVLAVLTTVPASILSVYCLAGVVSTAGTARAESTRLPAWLQRGVSSRRLQALGFLLAAASLLLTGLAISADFGATAIFCVFLGAKFFSMFGVPTTTFVIPNELFPQHVRASCNGLSAAAGKVGAFSGSFIFPYIYDDLGIAYIFYFSAVIALCGVACTLCFIPPPPPPPRGVPGTNKGAIGSEVKEGNNDLSSSESTPLMAI
jgi:MFS family permease